jgi:hypothetical protein
LEGKKEAGKGKRLKGRNANKQKRKKEIER